jgi:hypothetical protein
VQSATDVFAQAAVRAGLEVVVRGEYPVTVGKGFSAAFLTLSPEPILSPMEETWDVALVCSADGLRFTKERLSGVQRLALDASLEAPAPTTPPSQPVPEPTGAGLAHPTVSVVWRAAPNGLEVSETASEVQLEHTAPPPSPAAAAQEVERADFRGHGARLAAFSALLWLLRRERWFPETALEAAIEAVPSAKVRASMQKTL